MRSEIAQRIIDETPQSVRDSVRDYADLVDRVHAAALSSERKRLREAVEDCKRRAILYVGISKDVQDATISTLNGVLSLLQENTTTT